MAEQEFREFKCWKCQKSLLIYKTKISIVIKCFFCGVSNRAGVGPERKQEIFDNDKE